MTRRIASPCQTISCFPSCCLSCRFSFSRRCKRSALSRVSSNFSVAIGFSRKSTAPSRVARTAISMCACPDIITTGVATPSFLRLSSNHKPSFPGITTSERIKSNVSDFARSRAFVALSHTTASWPARRKARDSDASVFASSSTTRRCAFRGNLLPPTVARSRRRNRPGLGRAVYPDFSAIPLQTSYRVPVGSAR